MTMTCCVNVAKTLKMCWVISIRQSRDVSLNKSMTKRTFCTPFKRPSERFSSGSRSSCDFWTKTPHVLIALIASTTIASYLSKTGPWTSCRGSTQGFSWHITVAIRKEESKLETQAFVHVVEQCNQDSPCVVMLMEHVLATLKKENPAINRAFFIVKSTRGVTMLHTLF